MNLDFHVEGNPAEPLTRGEFAEAMQLIGRAFETVATKDDLKRFATTDNLQRFATKDDLVNLATDFEQRFASKDDLRQFEERLSSHIEKWGRLIFRKIDAAVEDRQIDMGAATREHVEAIQERQDRLNTRVTAIEHHVGLPPAA